MKNILILFLMIVSLHAFEKEKQVLMEYRHLPLAENMSLYAGSLNMHCFQNDRSYALGLLFHDSDQSVIDVALGYMQPDHRVFQYLNLSPVLAGNDQREEGLLVYLSYRF